MDTDVGAEGVRGRRYAFKTRSQGSATQESQQRSRPNSAGNGQADHGRGSSLSSTSGRYEYINVSEPANPVVEVPDTAAEGAAVPQVEPAPVDDTVDVSIAQQAAMEKFTESGLVVEFTDEQARELEEAALKAALEASKKEERFYSEWVLPQASALESTPLADEGELQMQRSVSVSQSSEPAGEQLLSTAGSFRSQGYVAQSPDRSHAIGEPNPSDSIESPVRNNDHDAVEEPQRTLSKRFSMKGLKGKLKRLGSRKIDANVAVPQEPEVHGGPSRTPPLRQASSGAINTSPEAHRTLSDASSERQPPVARPDPIEPVLKESEEQAQRQADEERAFQEMLAKALQDSQAETAVPVVEDVEEEMLRRILEESKLEEERRQKQEEELLRKALEDSKRTGSTLRSVSSGLEASRELDVGNGYEVQEAPVLSRRRFQKVSVPVNLTPAPANHDAMSTATTPSPKPLIARPRLQTLQSEEQMQMAVEASKYQAENDECVRETQQLRADFEMSMEEVKRELDTVYARRTEVEQQLEDTRVTKSPIAVELSAEYATLTKRAREMAKRVSPLQHAVEELQGLEEMLVVEKLPKAEFVVLKEAIMLQLSEELNTAGWGLKEGSKATTERYREVAQAVAQQTMPILQSQANRKEPSSQPAAAAPINTQLRTPTPASDIAVPPRAASAGALTATVPGAASAAATATTAKSDEPRAATAKSDEPRAATAKSDEPRAATAKSDEPRAATAKSDEPTSATGSSLAGAKPGNLDLNATLSGLRGMRQRIEERRKIRTEAAKKLDRASSASSKNERRSTYLAALENLKSSIQNVKETQQQAPQHSLSFSHSLSAQDDASERGDDDRQSIPGQLLDSGSSTEPESENIIVTRDRPAVSKGWFNPEDFLAQKREWSRNNLNDSRIVGWPSHCLEHLVVVGLPPTIDQKYVAAAAHAVQKVRSEPSEAGDVHRGPKGPALPAEILYSYPPDKPLANGDSIADFCFPHGVQPVVLERTPSMSSLNEVIYGQHYHDRDDHSFIFVLKVADNLPLYGVCCYVEEFVSYAPAIAKDKYKFIKPTLSRHVVSAPRCYCLLTHYPFFSLHFQVLDMMLGLGRLERITQAIQDLSQPEREDSLSSRLAAIEFDSNRSEQSQGSHSGFNLQDTEDSDPAGTDYQTPSESRMSSTYTTPVKPSKLGTLDYNGLSEDITRSLELSEASYESGGWSGEVLPKNKPYNTNGAHGTQHPDDDDQTERVDSGNNCSSSYSAFPAPKCINVASALQVLQHYYDQYVPQPGEAVELKPEPTLRPISYKRPRLKDVIVPPSRAAMATAEAEAADSLKHWTIAALCRCLSLDNILTLLTASLLERQMVVFCPNIGLLSAIVLAAVPLLRPFCWQSLMLPILPASMLGFVEAPVPFIVGMLYKTPEVRARCHGVMRVNVYKNRIKNVSNLPPLPGQHSLLTQLKKPYETLSSLAKEQHTPHQPVYVVSDAQKAAADAFLEVLHTHLSGICSNLRAHTITDVQTNDRVSMLLKDSFVESFSAKDKLFVKQFVETQLFSVYSDGVLQ